MSERLAQLPLLGALILLPVKVIQAEPPKDPIARSVNGNFVRTNPGGEHALLSFGREFKDRQGTPNAAHDLLKVREWIDANTAILYSYSQWFVGDDQGDLDANFLFTLKFDAERELENRQNPSDVRERSRKERKGRMKYFGTVLILVASTTTFVFSNAQESPSPAEEQPSISPDKKWGYIGGDTPKLVKLSTDETVIDFFEQLNPGTAPAGQDPELLWAPDSKRFGFNYSPMHAHHMTFQSIVFYQLRGDKWVALDSPADETKGPQLARFGKGHLPKHFDPRHCAPEWDIMKVRKWSDANTAIVYATCYGRESGKLEAGLLFTLKFDADGNWKIIKAHQMSKKELEEE